eukprot:TRINITY_DN114515_c0_g1_i1.p1 TRINITY_DN114515_c0_g1~~TRINITY_DN114515_c0_g1_i1.p1  ORF type:complete len:147 (-),score=4.21 TRINITY_DN114515_c0_g1_i1:288-728(-)
MPPITSRFFYCVHHDNFGDGYSVEHDSICCGCCKVAQDDEVTEDIQLCCVRPVCCPPMAQSIIYIAIFIAATLMRCLCLPLGWICLPGRCFPKGFSCLGGCCGYRKTSASERATYAVPPLIFDRNGDFTKDYEEKLNARGEALLEV